MRFNLLVLSALLAAGLPSLASAQDFGALQQDARPHVPGFQVRAMGGAVAAVPMDETAFFYNPAHLARLDLTRPRITFAGFGASVSKQVFEEYRYFRNELFPAIDEGLGNIQATDPERLGDLYERALDLGRSQTAATLLAYGPSIQASLSGNEAMGAGLFATNSIRAQFTDATGSGVPRLDTYDQLDLILPVTGAFGIPNSPLAVGMTTSYTRRYLTAKSSSLNDLDADEEHLYILKGSTMSVDVGLHAKDVMPNVDLGLAVYQILGGGFNYNYSSRIDITGNDGPDDEAEIAALEDRFNQRESKPTYRIGAAYRVPIPPSAAVVLDGVTVAMDYVSASTSEYSQETGAHVRMGIGADLAKIVSVRTGFSQGYPSFGASVRLPVVQLDYAYYGIEDGEAPGHLGRFNHQIQLRFGIF